jgi:peptidoglycan/LPS O-acetylase OafA/YrhL
VQAFFVISGFYMFMILSEKYHSYRAFIINRALRLWPVYAVVVVMTLGYSLLLLARGEPLVLPGIGLWLTWWDHMSLATKASLLFANIAMIGQDWTYFMALDPATGAVLLTDDFAKADQSLGYFILVPQAWSLGIELMFYLIVPFLVARRNWLLLTIFAATLLIRVALYKLGLYRDPWSYRFFPAELGLFVLGGVAYRLYSHLKNRYAGALSGAPPVIAFILILGYVFFYYSLPLSWNVRQWVFYVLVATLLPFLFHWTKDNKVDRYVGEMSYPIYIVHFFILGSTSCLANQAPVCGAAGAVASILLSMILLRYVQEPVDRIRHARVA